MEDRECFTIHTSGSFSISLWNLLNMNEHRQLTGVMWPVLSVSLYYQGTELYVDTLFSNLKWGVSKHRCTLDQIVFYSLGTDEVYWCLAGHWIQFVCHPLETGLLVNKTTFSGENSDRFKYLNRWKMKMFFEVSSFISLSFCRLVGSYYDTVPQALNTCEWHGAVYATCHSIKVLVGAVEFSVIYARVPITTNSLAWHAPCCQHIQDLRLSDWSIGFCYHCLGLEVLSLIPAWSMIIYQFLCGLYAFPCVRALMPDGVCIEEIPWDMLFTCVEWHCDNKTNHSIPIMIWHTCSHMCKDNMTEKHEKQAHVPIWHINLGSWISVQLL